MLTEFSEETFIDYLTLNTALNFQNIDKIKTLFEEIKTNNEPYLISHLAVNGNDLKQYGISGKKLGETLKYLQDFIIENPDLNSKDTLIKEVEKIIGN